MCEFIVILDKDISTTTSPINVTMVYNNLTENEGESMDRILNNIRMVNRFFFKFIT